jgi:RHS repeat-associated protein
MYPISQLSDPLAELKDFKGLCTFTYDGNGNFTSDGDQGLAIASNLINLPRIVASPSDSLLFEYTFGGEKIRKLQTSPVARDRIYLGGAEFVNDTLELYHHAEGRVVLSGVKPAFQYRIADHLGNTVVFFEDRDGDTKIKTESMTSDPDSLEVLQRNYYYPFGMEMEGPWQAATAPRADYLYNGKEFNEDLGLNWYDYGARYYDPSIGRWNGVDPLAGEYAAWSPYCYTLNNPVKFVDPDGMKVDDFIIVNSKGTEIGRIKDPKVNAVIIIPDQNLKTYEMGRYVWSFEFMKNLGTTYDVSSFKRFFDDNRNDFFDNSIPTFRSKDGNSAPSNIPVERAIPLYFRNGAVTTGDNRPLEEGGERIVGENPGQISSDKINAVKKPNQVGFLHNEPVNQINSPYIFGSPSRGYSQKSYSPNPSGFDETFYKPKTGFYSVIARPDEVVFFRSQSEYFRISWRKF